jgi:hypothetical protein
MALRTATVTHWWEAAAAAVERSSRHAACQYSTAQRYVLKYVHRYGIYMLPTQCICVHAVAQLVEALRYKPEGRGFDSRWFHWNFSST